MRQEHIVVVYPGLGDSVAPLALFMKHWPAAGLHLKYTQLGWHDAQDFQPKLDKLLAEIDSLILQGYVVSVLGVSAGGSAALNVFMRRQTELLACINVCGRLRVGPTEGWRSFAAKTKTSPAFAQSVMMCEAGLPQLSRVENVLTTRSIWDELVPPETTVLDGGTNMLIPTPEHMVSIAASVSVFSKPVIDFILSAERHH